MEIEYDEIEMPEPFTPKGFSTTFIRNFLKTCTSPALEKAFFTLGRPDDWQESRGYLAFKITMWNEMVSRFTDLQKLT